MGGVRYVPRFYCFWAALFVVIETIYNSIVLRVQPHVSVTGFFARDY